ncbi:antibiotic biosynthesis monooxygenase family protein [Streptomyces sp. PTD9-10]|uniref:antibiotic biosynthesis monooxygenase family protein n=1 Tax=Streptomyces sp. PTD9-10 TaxID=3120151 RepID=UPI00300B150E
MADKPAEEQSPSKLFTVINTFTLKDPAGAQEFERRFLEHVEWMRAQEGFHAHQAVRVTERPDVYVNLGWWREPEVFQQVLRSEVFQSHAKEFHQLVDVAADPSMNVLRIGAGDLTDAVIVIEHLTTEAGAEEFERTYKEYAEAAHAATGLARLDLARALTRAGAYTAITWWRSEEDRLKARESAEFAAVGRVAEVRSERAAHVARNIAAGK